MKDRSAKENWTAGALGTGPAAAGTRGSVNEAWRDFVAYTVNNLIGMLRYVI